MFKPVRVAHDGKDSLSPRLSCNTEGKFEADSESSPENLDDRKSPSSCSVSSISSSTDREKDVKEKDQHWFLGKKRSRDTSISESEDSIQIVKKQKPEDRVDSPTESSSESSSAYNDNADEADIEEGDTENNQDDLISTASSSVPSPGDNDSDYKPPAYFKDIKQDQTTEDATASLDNHVPDSVVVEQASERPASATEVELKPDASDEASDKASEPDESDKSESCSSSGSSSSSSEQGGDSQSEAPSSSEQDNTGSAETSSAPGAGPLNTQPLHPQGITYPVTAPQPAPLELQNLCYPHPIINPEVPRTLTPPAQAVSVIKTEQSKTEGVESPTVTTGSVIPTPESMPLQIGAPLPPSLVNPPPSLIPHQIQSPLIPHVPSRPLDTLPPQALQPLYNPGIPPVHKAPLLPLLHSSGAPLSVKQEPLSPPPQQQRTGTPEVPRSPHHIPRSPQRASPTPRLPIKAEPQSRSRSRSPIRDTESPDNEPPRSPTPESRIVDEEFFRTNSAIFIKYWWRGTNNSCSRCDFEFKPLPDSKLAKKRAERVRKAAPPPVVTPPTEEKEEKIEDKVAISRPALQNKKRAETPPENKSADAQITSTIMSSQHITPYGGPPDRMTPRGAYMPGHHDPTPALRQLSDIARPHVMGAGDPTRTIPYNIASLPPHMEHYYRGIYPPGSRERLELELERDKRERDARERELREHDLREMEFQEKFKQELQMKPPGFEQRLPPGVNAMDPHWMDIQRRFGNIPPSTALCNPGGGPPGHIPGVYPPASLANDLIQRERERLERLGLASGLSSVAGHMPADMVAAERLSAERLQVERMALATDPLVRLQMAGITPTSPQHNHTHAHAHTHLHLHQQQQQQQQELAAAAGRMHPLAVSHLLPLPPGADPLAIAAASGGPGGSQLSHGLPPGHPSIEAARQQELAYRDLLCRAQYSADPVIAHHLQLSAQAAQQDALQRHHMALERERLAAGAPPQPPPHLPH